MLEFELAERDATEETRHYLHPSSSRLEIFNLSEYFMKFNMNVTKCVGLR